MVRKIILGTLFIGLIGALIAGAIIRTVDRTQRVVEAQGSGYGRSGDEVGEHETGGLGQGRNGRGGRGRTRDSVAERQYPNHDGSPSEELLVREGTVVSPPEDGVDLVIETSDSGTLTVGTGPMYMASQGFILEAGDSVQVQGYWEDDEFKASQVTRLADGRTITLRDELGRPAWAGAGRIARSGQGR